MQANLKFRNQPKHFWAHVRSLSQQVGYTVRGSDKIKVPTASEIATAFKQLGLDSAHLADKNNKPTEYGTLLHDYFQFRADILNDYVEPRLMNADQARTEFESLFDRLKPTCPLPKNKQKGEKKVNAYLTAMVNMIIECNASGLKCDYDPRKLTTITKGGVPLRTLARRVDGAFPCTVNPIAVWEVKEYYFTTTFGSRVADGVYETLLDGMELEELHEHEGIKVLHYLMVDAYYTWWNCGKSYLCRMIDMLHMGYVDEILFGREVIERLPNIVKSWVDTVKSNQ